MTSREQRPMMDDDLGAPVRVPVTVGRVVSIVPSLTESLAATRPGLLVGATDWCTHPGDLGVVRVGGTKNPDLEGIQRLAPDLVVANEEENRPDDLRALREAGLNVWVTRVRTVPEAFTSLRRMLAVACGPEVPGWLLDAEKAWSSVSPGPAQRVIVPIWRRPWMVVGRDTFTGDVLARLGQFNVFGDHAERYPKIPLDELRSVEADLVVLPDEPYAFTRGDGPEAFEPVPAALVSGRHLTWYGPSLAQAPEILRRQLS
ncbi:helical backbone metal receptor [Kineosporia mesophila]|nr:helical backbone metal receptor [Kineosporia mesophila]